ncbi:MAG: penicillin-insensitive murein endopeptidase [Nannocystaceae bacterium]|nr:penicillin-insensitive murein endopeptidase [Nannocystaceae bacterium]
MTDARQRPVVHKGIVGDDDLVDWPGDPEAPERDDALVGAGARTDDDDREAAADDDDDREAAADDDDDANADDDDASADDDDASAHDEAPPPPRSDDVVVRAPKRRAPPAKRRVPAGAMLMLGAGALWATVMAMRCRPAAAPTASIPAERAEPPPAAQPSEPTPPSAPIEDAAPPEPAADTAVPHDAPPPPGADDDAPPPGMPDTERVPQRRDDWAEGLELPQTVRYTVRRGGTLENVANLFKIFHHEILALNPGIALDRELAPNTRVVVWKRDGDTRSQSVGYPSAGSLEGAVPMVEGNGRRILAIGWKTWGADTTIAMLDALLDRWAARGKVQPILVGNIANRTGGRLEPHSTHQSGRDVDLGYPQILAPGAELNWQEMNAKNLDAAETWALLLLLGDSGAVEEIYIDREIQKLLYDYALESELLSKSALAKWMEYPRPTGSGGALIQHVPGHTDHLHVRFFCAPSQDRCKSR